MARTPITPLGAPTRYSQTGTALTFTPADTVNGNSVAISSVDTYVIAYNDGASAATLTIASVATPTLGYRTGNTVLTLAAGTFAITKVTTDGFRQTGDVLHLDAGGAGAADVNICAYPA